MPLHSKVILGEIDKEKFTMKIISIITLILALLITLAACGGDNGPAPDDITNTSPQNESPSPNNGGESGGNANVPSDGSSSIVERITVVERDTGANAASHFDARIISETLVDTGFGMNDDFGGCFLVFELENISGRAVTVDISAASENGHSASLIDQNIRFEPDQARRFTHSFGEYAYAHFSHLIIEYMNVRY